MEHVLLFNNMINSLSPKEYILFTTHIFKQKELLQSLLFNTFVSQLFANPSTFNNNCNVKEINNILRNIIQTRNNPNICEMKPKKQIELNHIPKELINYISSFLITSENIAFSLSSRFTYIACRSATKFHQITRTQMQKYHAYFSENNAKKLAKDTINRLRYTTNLSLDCTHLIAIKYLSMNRSIWNSLTTLNLHHCNVPDLLISLNHLNFQNSQITSLIINDLSFEETIYFTEETHDIAMVDEPEEFNSFIKIIKQFPLLQFLSLISTNSCIENYNLSTKCISEIPSISNLKGLTIHWVHPESIINNILLKCHSTLKSLHIGHNDGIFGYVRWAFPKDVKKYNFRNIEELCIDGDIENEDAEILNTINGNNLRRVCISQHYKLPKSVISLLCYAQLECISLRNSLDVSLNILNNILMVKRNRLRVHIKCYDFANNFNKDMYLRFVKVLKTLTENVNHFMMILTADFNKSELNKTFSRLKQQYLIHKQKNKLIVSNLECNLNGYQE
eukprot:425499_1